MLLSCRLLSSKGMSHITGEVDLSIIPEKVQFFWDFQCDTVSFSLSLLPNLWRMLFLSRHSKNQNEHLTRTPLKDGHEAKQNMIDMGEAPELWFASSCLPWFQSCFVCCEISFSIFSFVSTIQVAFMVRCRGERRLCLLHAISAWVSSAVQTPPSSSKSLQGVRVSLRYSLVRFLVVFFCLSDLLELIGRDGES